MQNLTVINQQNTKQARSNYQLAQLSAYRSDHLHDHEDESRCADRTNRNRATSIEWKWT